MSSENAKFATTSLFNVEGWTVLVTGGGTGIGLMIAQAFANNGARVYIVGRRPDALQNAVETWGRSLSHPKGELIPVTADITDKASIEKLAKEISSKEKKLDVLVNNAGVSLGTSSTEKGEESAEALQQELWKEKWEDWEDTANLHYSDISLRPSRSSLFYPRQIVLTTSRQVQRLQGGNDSLEHSACARIQPIGRAGPG